MVEQIDLSGPELVFVQRMLPHFMAGKSAAEAAQAVLDDDARLLTSFCDRASSQFVPGYNDYTGRAHRTREGKGDVIVSTMARTVYECLRNS